MTRGGWVEESKNLKAPITAASIGHIDKAALEPLVEEGNDSSVHVCLLGYVHTYVWYMVWGDGRVESPADSLLSFNCYLLFSD